MEHVSAGFCSSIRQLTYRCVHSLSIELAIKTMKPLLLCLFACLILSDSSRAQLTLPTALGVGAFLDKLTSDLKEAEEKAIGGGEVLEIGAGGEIARLIQQAKDAYADSLQLTLSQVGAEEQKTLAALQDTVQSFIDKSYTSISALEDKALAVAHVLPFSKDYPNMWSYVPHYVPPPISTDDKNVTIHLDGDFLDVTEPKYSPSLAVSGKTFQASARSTGFVEFQIPRSDLLASDTKINVETLQIDIPYKKSTLIVFENEKHTTFSLPLVMLPKSAGTVTITTTSSSPGKLRQPVTSPEFRQESGDDDIKDGGEHAELAIHKWFPDPGFQVIPSTVGYKITWSQGKGGVDQDWWFSRNLSTALEAVLCFSTEHHRFGTSGKVHFLITFTEEKDVNNTTSVPTSAVLPWNSSKVFSLPTGASWKGKIDLFDGRSFEFAGPYSNEYVRVSPGPTTVTVTSVP